MYISRASAPLATSWGIGPKSQGFRGQKKHLAGFGLS